MDKNKLLEELSADEGCKLKPYLDTATPPNLTVGIGHLVLQADDLTADGEITLEEATELFWHDVDIATMALRSIFAAFDDLPDEVQRVLVNVMFNLGKIRFLGFRKFIAAIVAGNWKQAAAELRDSKAYEQLHNRYERLSQRLETIA